MAEERRVSDEDPTMVLNDGPRIVTTGALSSSRTSTCTVLDDVMPRKEVRLNENE